MWRDVDAVAVGRVWRERGARADVVGAAVRASILPLIVVVCRKSSRGRQRFKGKKVRGGRFEGVD